MFDAVRMPNNNADDLKFDAQLRPKREDAGKLDCLVPNVVPVEWSWKKSIADVGTELKKAQPSSDFSEREFMHSSR